MALNAAALSNELVEVVERVGRSVVRVEGGRRRPASGVVVAPGRVVTSSRALPLDEVEVVSDGGSFRAKVKGRDLALDLSLLELDTALPALTRATQAPKVGQLVLRLGRPGESVRATSGIVSAASAKSWTTGSGAAVEGYVDSDAPIQPGFVGGPLLSLSGGVLGLVTLPGRAVTTLPFAAVERSVGALEQGRTPRKSTLGTRLVPVQLPPAVRTATGESIGLMVMDVLPDSPAAKAGLSFGDTLLHLGDDLVKTLEDFVAFLAVERAGQTVPAKVLRGGKVEALSITLA